MMPATGIMAGGAHTPRVIAEDSPIAQTDASGHILITKPGMPPLRSRYPDPRVPQLCTGSHLQC